MMHSMLGRLTIMSMITSVLMTALSTGLVLFYVGASGASSVQSALAEILAEWQTGNKPSLSPVEEAQFRLRGYIVARDGTIIHTYGPTACGVGTAIERCFPDFNTLTARGRAVQHSDDHQTWIEAKQSLLDGDYIVVSYQPMGNIYAPFTLLLLTALITLLLLPVALLLSWLLARPLAYRLHTIVLDSSIFVQDTLMQTAVLARDEIVVLKNSVDRLVQIISQQGDELRQLAVEHNALRLALVQTAHKEGYTASHASYERVAQQLFGMTMGIASLAEHIRRDPADAALRAEQLTALAEQIQDELRAGLSHLRPPALSHGSLLETLTAWVNDWQQCNGITVTMQLEQLASALPLSIEETLLRTCQVVLNTLPRQAGAKHVLLVLRATEERLWLEIRYDGSTSAQTATADLGLIGVRERVRAEGGQVEISNTLGAGTCIQVFLPLCVSVTGR